MKKLGFGFMRLPLNAKGETDNIDNKTVCKMVDRFFEEGFNYFDTAYFYHQGKSELSIKETLVKRHTRESFKLANKLPMMLIKTKEDQERIFEEQFEKCAVDYFDNYLIHNLGESSYELAQKLDSFAFIAQKKKEGRLKKIGFSFHDKALLLDRILTEHPEVDFVQLQINYLDWDNASIQSRKCYEVARKHNKPIIVMEPVKGGMLVNQMPEKAVKAFKNYSPDLSVASWAIRFAASLEGVMLVLSGMSNLEQIEDNMSYMKNFTPLNNEEKSIIENVIGIIKEAIAIPCTDCQYCIEGCPKNIAIPSYFALYNMPRQRLISGALMQELYYANYSKTYGKASECIECKICEKKCPQHIEITKWLKKVAEEFEKA